MYEYKIEHYGASEPDAAAIKNYVGPEVFESADYSFSVESPSSTIVAISSTDASRVAFAKTIEYMLTVSDLVAVQDL